MHLFFTWKNMSKTTIAVSIAAACAVALTFRFTSLSWSTSSRKLSDGQASTRRPVMHTFFSELQPNPHDSRHTTAGMTADAHTEMIKAWEEAWQEAGWDTRILTIDDAKKHPDYNYWNPTIQSFQMSQYDMYCFYRWIAMAAVGGGWMSDYDTLPLHNFTEQGLELPSQGAFTCYGLFVPALLSGNASEWNRMVHRMVEYANEHTPRSSSSSSTTTTGSAAKKVPFNTPSDMMSLLGIMQDAPSTFIAKNEVVGSYDTRGEWTREFCDRTFPNNLRAMHFSHYFVHDIWMPDHPGLSLDDRGSIAKSWLDRWLAVCQRQVHADLMMTTTLDVEQESTTAATAAESVTTASIT